MAIDTARIQKVAEAAVHAAPGTAAKFPAGAQGFNRKDTSGARAGRRLRWLLELGSHRITLDDLALFARQLALLLRTGNGLVPSVAALARQGCSTPMREELGRVHAQLQEGKSLSECLEHNQAVFGPMFINLVRAGEATGALQDSLEELTRMLEIQKGLRARIREAMAYPIVLLCIMSGVMVFMMAFVLPRFADLFEGIEDELPITTRLLLSSGSLLNSRSWLMVPIIGSAALLAGWLWRSGRLQRAWDRLRFRIPLVGALIEQALMLRFFSSMGLLLGNHVPLLEAIDIARKLVNSARYRSFFEGLTRNVEAGRGVTPAFQEARFLPDTVKLMVATGESSGALDEVIASLADRYREDLERGVKRLSTLLEPIMIVVMGALVGLIAISFIVPIFKMSKAVH